MSELGLRADAERNRQRILVAAQELFLERGASVSLDEVATVSYTHLTLPTKA